VEPGFLDEAPVRMAFSAVLAASPGEVYHVLADETGAWPSWFAGVERAEAHGDGRRTVVVSGGTRTEETVLVAERPRRYAYRADTVNRPGLCALMEEWRIEPVAGGAMVRWTIAADGTRVARAFLRALRPGLRSVFRRTAHGLDLRCAALTARRP
jgi:hypothetical protein